jgi:hypothetical protein
MIKTILAKGDQEYLYKLFETYSSIDDKKEILKISGKLIQKANKVSKNELILVFDSIHEIINKDRKAIRTLNEMEVVNRKSKKDFKPSKLPNGRIYK